MPAQVEINTCVMFRARFLIAILRDVSDTKLSQSTNVIDGPRLRHDNESDLARIATAVGGDLRDSRA